MADYYAGNLMARLAAIEQRLAAVEKRGGGQANGGDLENTASMPPGTVINLTGLYIPEEETGDIYRLTCRYVDGQPKLYLAWVRSGAVAS